MEWIVGTLVLLGIGAVAVRRAAAPPTTSSDTHRDQSPSLFDLEAEFRREVEIEAARLQPQIDAEAARLRRQLEAEVAQQEEAQRREEPEHESAPEPAAVEEPMADPGVGPTWMPVEDWQKRLEAYRRQGRSDSEVAEIAAYLEARGPRIPRTREEQIARSEEIGIVTRAVYAPKEDEDRYLVRNDEGRPMLHLVEAGDRLAIWSPVDGGALINPKGAGLRTLGLYSSQARGTRYHLSAYRRADLRPGQWIELRRQPDNEHDRNAVAMHAPGAVAHFAFVQRGRAPAVARRIDAGEDMAAVSMRGVGKGRTDGTSWLLIGSRADLEHMLSTE